MLTKAIWADKKWAGLWQISLYIQRVKKRGGNSDIYYLGRAKEVHAYYVVQLTPVYSEDLST